MKNKKVLLRERKRHTDRGISSTTRGGTTPVGVPLGQVQWGYPRWGTPRPGLTGGYPKWGTPPAGAGPGWGTPPDLAGIPPLGVDRQTDTCQNITFPSYAVGNNTLENETQGSLLITARVRSTTGR